MSITLLDYSLFPHACGNRQKMTQPLPSPIPLCSVCGKPVALETSKTDDSGKAVHEECYTAQIAQGKRRAENS